MVDAALTPLFTTQPYPSAIPPSTITGAQKRNSRPGTTTIGTVLKTQRKGMQQRCQMRSGPQRNKEIRPILLGMFTVRRPLTNAE